MPITAETLNQYTGTDAQGNQTTIVAPDMETACNVYKTQETTDPNIMQCTKRNIKCVLPDQYVTFKAEAYDPTGVAASVCSVAPAMFTVTAGTKQIFTATAGEGWSFKEWQVDGQKVDDATGPVSLLTIPANSTGQVSIKAVFEAS